MQDYAVAVSWFRRAAEQGYALGQAALGFMYSRGRGVVQDDAEAVRWGASLGCPWSADRRNPFNLEVVPSRLGGRAGLFFARPSRVVGYASMFATLAVARQLRRRRICPSGRNPPGAAPRTGAPA